MKHLALCALVAAALLFAPPARAQESGVAQEPMPQQQPAPAGNDWMDYRNPYYGELNDLSNPHRTVDEIIVWAQKRATDVMSFMSDREIMTLEDRAKANNSTFAGESMNDKLRRIKTIFTQRGWAEYADFMRRNKVDEMVRLKDYSVTTIVNGNSLVIDSGAVGGSYHWMVRMPLMVTFLLMDMEGRAQASPATEFELVMQLGRSAESTDPDALAIEGWQITPKGE